MEQVRKLVRQIILESKRPKNIGNMLKSSKFKDLPLEYQIAVVIYCQEGVEELWKGIKDHSPIKNWWTDKRVPKMIENYKKIYGLRTFKYGYIPTEILIEKVSDMLKKRPEYYGTTDFYDYHQHYQSSYGVDHGPSVIPVILYRDGIDEDEPIEDGWHRFHSYVKKGLREIPVLMFMPL